MSGVLARIRSVYESLPMAERKVADVVLVAVMAGVDPAAPVVIVASNPICSRT